jgi:hypothetical protein
MSTVHLSLSLVVGSNPIEGTFATEEREPQPFCGWVELTAAIEAARADRAPGPQPGVSL